MERCSEHGDLAKDIKGTREDVSGMRSDLKNAIEKVTEHIQGGTRWRLTIFSACVVLVGTIVGGIVRFSVMEYKLITIQDDQKVIREQIYDLNYEKGRLAGIAENGNQK